MVLVKVSVDIGGSEKIIHTILVTEATTEHKLCKIWTQNIHVSGDQD
jgi:hypothetical protein